MDLDSLRLFVAVAEAGSFAAVARARDVDPSSVSRAVAGLEAGLGVRLLQRTTRAMALTEAGARFLADVGPLIEEFDRAVETAAGLTADPVGTIRLTASVAFGEACLVPLLARFAARFPRLTLDLAFSDRTLDLVAERIDLAIRLGPGFGPELIGVRLFPTRYLVVASPGYVEAAGALAAPAALGARSCLLFALPEFRTRWLVERDGRTEEVPVAGQFQFSTASALRAAALAGLGPALLADWLIRDDLAAGRLVDLLPGCRATATSFETAAWLLYPSRRHLPAKVRAVIDFLRTELAPVR